MARLAKRKSDAAWERTMQIVLRKFGATERTALTAVLQADAEVIAMVEAYLEIISETGLATTETSDTLVAKWVTTGIPREVWYGYSRFDRYAKHGSDTFFSKVHGKTIRQGANSFRALITQFIQSWKMLLDLQNEKIHLAGNPGGKADALKDVF